ncbi:MAG TPA: ankyrin repeat domain-containing protein, partial [Symbiobacteriaceae bacterium]|nr:ankyrin repeat domain-containing protein [Symbiobacteriaceae bacterium]
MMQRLLRPNRGEAPRKKLRGLRRYFRRVFARAESETLELEADHWFDLKHYHADRYGYGNLSWPMRARHLEAMATVFKRYARELSQFEKPYQLWIYLNTRDAGQDAVFVHSPNPQHDDFPVLLDDADWGITEVSRYFEGLLPGFRLRAGRWGNSECYYVYASGVGVPLERSLHLAASTGEIQAAARLLGKGAAIDGLDANGLTPLHAAAGH